MVSLLVKTFIASTSLLNPNNGRNSDDEDHSLNTTLPQHSPIWIFINPLARPQETTRASCPEQLKTRMITELTP